MQLPSLSLVKLQRLLQAEQDARDAAGAVSLRLSETNKALATAPASEYANIEAESARLLSRQTDLAARHRNIADVNAAIRHWISTAATGTLEYVRPTKPLLQKGETLTAAVLRLRERIGALSAERVKVMQAGVPRADLKASAIQYADGLAQRGGPRIVADHDRFEIKFEGALTWEDSGLAAKIPAFLCWLDPEAFKARLLDTIDKMPEPPTAMTAKAKAEKLIALEAELLQCEREEEALVEASEEGEGPLVTRRLTANPLAIMCLSKVQPKAAVSERKVGRVKAGAA